MPRVFDLATDYRKMHNNRLGLRETLSMVKLNDKDWAADIISKLRVDARVRDVLYSYYVTSISARDLAAKFDVSVTRIHQLRHKGLRAMSVHLVNAYLAEHVLDESGSIYQLCIPFGITDILVRNGIEDIPTLRSLDKHDLMYSLHLSKQNYMVLVGRCKQVKLDTDFY